MRLAAERLSLLPTICRCRQQAGHQIAFRLSVENCTPQGQVTCPANYRGSARISCAKEADQADPFFPPTAAVPGTRREQSRLTPFSTYIPGIGFYARQPERLIAGIHY